VSPTESCLAEIRAEFPAFRLVRKADSPFCRALDLGLRILTLNGQRFFLSRYHTVIGYTLYVPEAWDGTPELERVVVLRHERVHMRQRRRLGLLMMAFLYLIPFFPLGLAYGRARIEWEAYQETLRAKAELLGLEAARAPLLRRELIERFTGPAYGWMWPFPSQVERWIDEMLAELDREYAQPARAADADPGNGPGRERPPSSLRPFESAP
jgi:hypothetical protein